MPAEALGARPVRVGLYARVSTRDRDQDPAVQLAALREYVTARGWAATEYVDEAPAGDLARRTAWARLLADARQRRIDRVLTWKLDRAFRSTLHALRTLESLDGWGVGFEVLTQAIDTTPPTGQLVFAVLAAVAEMERSLIADRVREGMAHARRQGKAIGRPRVQDRPGFAERWARIAPELAAGRLSQRQAARRLRVGVATLARLRAAVPKGKGSAEGSECDRPRPRPARSERWSFRRGRRTMSGAEVGLGVFGFKPKARPQRFGLLWWREYREYRRYRVGCTCGYRGRTRLTKDEATHAAEDHMVRKHGAVGTRRPRGQGPRGRGGGTS